MEIETALQKYLIGLREYAPPERLEFDLSVLARLQEYLLGGGAPDDAAVGRVSASAG